MSLENRRQGKMQMRIPLSINPLAAIPAKTDECQGSGPLLGKGFNNAARHPYPCRWDRLAPALDIQESQRSIGREG